MLRGSKTPLTQSHLAAGAAHRNGLAVGSELSPPAPLITRAAASSHVSAISSHASLSYLTSQLSRRERRACCHRCYVMFMHQQAAGFARRIHWRVRIF